jgi:hypothetical protein
MAHAINNSRTNPQGAFIVWSFKHRHNAKEFSNDLEALQIGWVYKLTKSLKSMSTKKTKGTPAGTFEVRLAPTANWIARLTPGSWCSLLMTKNIELDLDNVLSAKADKASLKMFGVITDVRVSVEVDETTGARRTEYVVSGKDWGHALESNLYIDPVARGDFLTPDGEQANAVGTAAKIFFDKQRRTWLEETPGAAPTSTLNVKALLATWGQPIKNLLEAADNQKVGVVPGLTLTSGTFKFPPQVMSYLNFDLSLPAPSLAIADNITWYTGRLAASDGVFHVDNNEAGLGAIFPSFAGGGTYEEIEEAGGFPDPESTFGENSIWQLMVDNSNYVLNEMIADIRWEGAFPKLAIYKRIKPFIMNPDFEGNDEEGIKDKTALFKDVRTFEIPLGNVINVHAGTDFETLRNFVEVRHKPSPLITGTIDNQTKLDSQLVDRASVTRHGFRAAIKKTDFIPFKADKEEGVKVDELVAWKYLLTEWYFNQYAQLNGSLTMLGQNMHIGVGDNIRVSSKILGPSGNFNKEQKELQDGKGGQDSEDPTFLTCHVEQISHSFDVKPNGARSFITTIAFSRGIITDKEGNQVNEGDSIAIDKTAPTEWSDTLNVDVWSTSTEGDPSV